MVFAGLKKKADRKNLVAFLSTCQQKPNQIIYCIGSPVIQSQQKKLGYYKTTTLLLYFPVYTTLVFVRFAHISTHPPFFIDLFISQSKKKSKINSSHYQLSTLFLTILNVVRWSFCSARKKRRRKCCAKISVFSLVLCVIWIASAHSWRSKKNRSLHFVANPRVLNP